MKSATFPYGDHARRGNEKLKKEGRGCIIPTVYRDFDWGAFEIDRF
ncbi:hypothetical protein OKW34_003360 [Paraburkholderia youngii]